MSVRAFHRRPPHGGEEILFPIIRLFNNTRLVFIIVLTVCIAYSTITLTLGSQLLGIADRDHCHEIKINRKSSSVGGDTQTGGNGVDGGDADLAFFIQVSNATVHLLPRLLRALYHPQNVYVVHFDLNIPPDIRESAWENILRGNDKYSDYDTRNVHIMPSELITYGGISILLNTINAMQLLLQEHPNWDYFINLSGSDYPLVTPQTARTLLGGHKGGDGKKALNFFSFFAKDTWNMMGRNRLTNFWYDEGLSFRQNTTWNWPSKMVGINPLWKDRQFVVVKAEAWMIVSRDFCDFVIHDGLARKLLLALAYGGAMDEHYFPTVAWNHERLNKTIVPDAFREIRWVHEEAHSGSHPFNLDVVNNRGEYKFLEILTSSSAFFARKFKEVDSKLMGLLDENAQQKSTIERVSSHVEKIVGEREQAISQL